MSTGHDQLGPVAWPPVPIRTERLELRESEARDRAAFTTGRADDPLPWDRLDETDAVYVTAGDAGAFRMSRRARVTFPFVPTGG